MNKTVKIKWRKAKRFYCILDFYWQIGFKEFIIKHNFDFKEFYCNEDTKEKMKKELTKVYQTYNILDDEKIYGNKKYKKKRKSKQGTITYEQIAYIETDFDLNGPTIDNELKDNILKIIY